MKRSVVGWWWRGVAPDAHTPTLTNYHCVLENEEEVKTGAPRTQMRQFVRFCPQRRNTRWKDSAVDK